jgi:hypothetical protein
MPVIIDGKHTRQYLAVGKINKEIKTKVMKKLIVFAFALLVSGALLAQEAKETKVVKKSFLILNAGPSFPVGVFNAKDFNKNENAGYAKTGFTINLNYGYQFHKNAGATAALFFNNYNADQLVLIPANGGGEGGPSQPVSLQLDHWKLWGLAAGPMLTFDISENIKSDLRLMGGIVNANSPKAVGAGQSLAKEDWRIAGVFRGGLDLRFNTGGNVFVFTNADYMYTKPKFKIEFGSGVNDVFTRKQKMSAINLTGGVGVRF